MPPYLLSESPTSHYFVTKSEQCPLPPLEAYREITHSDLSAGYGINGMENGMERKFGYGVWKMPEWNGMEDNLLYFHTNSILDFVHGICRKIYKDFG